MFLQFWLETYPGSSCILKCCLSRKCPDCIILLGYVFSYPDSGLGEVGPHRDLLPGAHVRVSVPLESGFQLLQLLAGEVSPLPSLLLFLGLIRISIVTSLLDRPLLFWGE